MLIYIYYIDAKNRPQFTTTESVADCRQAINKGIEGGYVTRIVTHKPGEGTEIPLYDRNDPGVRNYFDE